MKHMVEAAVGLGALQRQDVQRLLDHADDAALAAVVGAHTAGVYLGDVLADGTEGDALLDLEDGGGERLRLGGRHAKEVIGEALSALGADAREFVELVDQASKGGGRCGGYFVQSGVTCGDGLG